MVVLARTRSAILFIYLMLNTKYAISKSNDVINFINSFMRQPVAYIFGNSNDTELISKANGSKVLINFQSNDLDTSKITLDRRTSYIFVVDDFKELNLALKVLTSTRKWNNRQKYLIIFHKPVTLALVRQSFRLMFRHYIYNTVAYYKNNTFYTWYPYGEQSKCGTKVHLEKVRKRNPFDNKIQRVLQGCSVNVTWSQTGIFVWDAFNKTLPGAMFLVLNTIAKKMNMTVTYLKNNTEFLKSQVKTGNFDMLENDMNNRNIDLAFYGAINGDAARNLENSVRVHQDNYFFLLPPRSKHLRKNYVVNMYETSLLCGTLASVTISCLIWKHLTKQSLIDSAFDIFQLAIQLFVTKKPTSNRCRTFFISLLIFLMCLNIAYQTKLSSLLTMPSYTPRITSVRELLFHSDVKVIRTFNNTLRLLYTAKDLKDGLRAKLKVFPNNLKTIDLIEHFLKNQTEAIPIANYHLHHFKNPEKLHLIYNDPVSLLIHFIASRKGFPLMEPINHWINILKESGLSHKFLLDSRGLLKKFEYKQSVGHEPFETLKLEHLEGAFVIWFVGIIAAGIAFLIEIKKGYGKYYYIQEISFMK